MRVRYLLTILLLASFGGSLSASVSYSQDDEINQRSRDGKKQGRWVYFGKDRPEAGYPLEGKIEEGPYKDDRKEGIWTRYYNDGETPKLVGEYHNNRPEGAFTKYFPNGKMRESGVFVKGIYQDSLKRYHENGKLEYAGYYNANGQEEGPVKFYYPNGQVEFEYQSQNGKPTGKAVRYYENGDIKELLQYNSDGSVAQSEHREMVHPEVVVRDPGVSKETAPRVTQPRTKGAKFLPNGYNKVYNENDEIWQDGEFRNGQLWEGKVYVYDRDGILLKVKVFKNGLYHSDGQL